MAAAHQGWRQHRNCRPVPPVPPLPLQSRSVHTLFRTLCESVTRGVDGSRHSSAEPKKQAKRIAECKTAGWVEAEWCTGGWARRQRHKLGKGRSRQQAQGRGSGSKAGSTGYTKKWVGCGQGNIHSRLIGGAEAGQAGAKKRAAAARPVPASSDGWAATFISGPPQPGWLPHPLRRHTTLAQAQGRHQLRAAQLLLRVGVHLLHLPLLHLLLLLLHLQLLQERGVDARRQARHALRLQGEPASGMKGELPVSHQSIPPWAQQRQTAPRATDTRRGLHNPGNKKKAARSLLKLTIMPPGGGRMP
jgi:hypothetical protein